MLYSLTLRDKLLTKLALGLLRLIYLLCTKEFKYSELSLEILQARRPLIIAFWHGQQLMLPFLYQSACKKFGHFKFAMLISAHRDGRLISEVIKSFGIDSVAGSSTRLARSASKGLLKALNLGTSVGITPDGPKGPCHEAKLGVFKLSEMSATPILPVKVKFSKSWKFNSWDQMELPKPFCKITFIIQDPLSVEPDSELEQAQIKLKIALQP